MSEMDKLMLLKLYKALKKKSGNGELTDIEKRELANIKKTLSIVLTMDKRLPKGFERREQARAKTNFTIRCQTSEELQNVYAKNISGGGLFIETNEPPPLGSMINCELQLPGKTDLIPIEGKIVWVNDKGMRGLERGVGIKFVKITKENRKRMDQAVRNMNKETIHDHGQKNKK